MVIYVTKGKGPERMRGNVVGILEISRNIAHAKNFISGDRWAAKESDPESRGKWLYAVGVSRAWRVAEEDWRPVDQLLPATYGSTHPEHIGAQGVPINPSEIPGLLQLTVYEVPVYGQTDQIQGSIQPLQDALYPSRAVFPSTQPFWVGETDGPKHLYILRLAGDIAAYLGNAAEDLADKLIVKVGFSRSPLSRRDQIQSAYPNGQYRWEVHFPVHVPEIPPFPNARVAIAGEDAMKKRLQEDGGRSLGGEFFLADEGLIIRAWAAGQVAAQNCLNNARAYNAE